jgi:hypothetical protein
MAQKLREAVRLKPGLRCSKLHFIGLRSLNKPGLHGRCTPPRQRDCGRDRANAAAPPHHRVQADQRLEISAQASPRRYRCDFVRTSRRAPPLSARRGRFANAAPRLGRRARRTSGRYCPNCSGKLTRSVVRAMAREPSQRYTSVTAFGKSIAKCLPEPPTGGFSKLASSATPARGAS